MPGIANKYFPIRATTFSVLGMTSARARAAAHRSAPGYALGVFRHQAAAPGTEFTGLVRDGRVRDLSGVGTVNDLLQ